jgi:hypothetical protein
MWGWFGDAESAAQATQAMREAEERRIASLPRIRPPLDKTTMDRLYMVAARRRPVPEDPPGKEEFIASSKAVEKLHRAVLNTVEALNVPITDAVIDCENYIGFLGYRLYPIPRIDKHDGGIEVWRKEPPPYGWDCLGRFEKEPRAAEHVYIQHVRRVVNRLVKKGHP